MKNLSYRDEVVNGFHSSSAMSQQFQPTARPGSSSPVVPTLSVDFLLLFIAGVAAFLFSRAIGLAEASQSLQEKLIAPPPWLVLVVVLIAPIWFLILDGIHTTGNRLKLPFAGGQRRAQRIYADRVHVVLLAFYFSAILVALCWSAAGMVLFSKLFLSSVFAIAIFAMGKSIPSTRLSFMLSGILFIIVLIATQTFIIFKMQAEQEAAEQQLRQQLELNQEE
jgi:signal transduction histidine kinase